MILQVIQVTITATLSNGTYQDVTVSIDGTGGTGTEGTDFGTVSDITISAGSTTGTAAVDPTDDSIVQEAQQEQLILHQLMTVCMKVMKRQLLL